MADIDDSVNEPIAESKTIPKTTPKIAEVKRDPSVEQTQNNTADKLSA